MVHSLPFPEFFSAAGPVLDVRSPSEYAQGHIPGAISFPLFTDAERAQVGTCYKQEGRDAAVELGFAIAGPKFAGFIQQAKALAGDRRIRVHCWRGGMRSGAVAWVLEMAGFQVTTLIGGYKAFRRWALQTFEEPRPIVILGGMTGTGKTDILHALAETGEQVLDLEDVAHHRGSSFGSLMLPPQPTNEQFENQVALQWATFSPHRRVWIEAESKSIGLCRVPNALFDQMDHAPILEVVRPTSERLVLLVDLYAQAPLEGLITATERIRKRLGGARTQEAIDLLQQHRFAEAFELMLFYYDRTYQYDLQRRTVSRYSVDATGYSAAEIARLLLEKAEVLPLP
ncbi:MULTISPECIES: tRNA 2-selenouridine(34) synthase MnmH [unclassified Leptolyngbya]|uniref:tRNA 2-selenouridine(34) synthase MnmH n=1 Tax=unclassified Leptolyngbya TaxID=2650499 RepID=UPI001684680A|nr:MULTISPECIES: tRNA 2-selenouridine(34) synthase MnmH [unclassified Leptolyngbya]MBD1913752.1 tRNA 2-selenouridine(34) synthase MnmH [Leptolyngbya sp. FACHB-8]MBD2153212.1 tRNA 2-selenouridine(34) synthase MnmH [Leptolyngbya sp. FACHB-16]